MVVPNNLRKKETITLADNSLLIGDVFTPLKWGVFAIEAFGIYDRWLAGASIFDPTMGTGNLLKALITYGLSQNKTLSQLPIQNLYGNELNKDYYQQAINNLATEYQINPHNFTNKDFLFLDTKGYDIVFGNPPWQNFVDLPDSYKEKVKPFFFNFDLASSKQKLLLGRSRIDFAALIIKKSIKEFLIKNGKAYFFMPLSLLLNDGANEGFRNYRVYTVPFSIDKIFDFKGVALFKDIATRFCLAEFTRDQEIVFPVSFYRKKQDGWREYFASPQFEGSDPLSVFKTKSEIKTSIPRKITINKTSMPRQGINTCGANDIFFFDSCTALANDLVMVSNKMRDNIILPSKYIFPLITVKNFQHNNKTPNKWVLLPYHSNARPLEESEIAKTPSLLEYLHSNKIFLQSRKGVLINAQIKKDYWWALLGVGTYSFANYKIVWEAYGKREFSPEIFTGNWQANQSLQAFMPFEDISEAERVLMELKNDRIEKHLLSLKMEGTMNWAQPGKIKKLLLYEEAP